MNEQRWRRQRRAILVGLYVLFPLSGTATALGICLPSTNLPPDFWPHVDLLFAILMSLGLMWLCTVDAKLAGKPLIHLAKLGIFLGWPIGVPIYLLWARGIRGFGLFLLHGFLLFLAVICAIVAVVCVFHTGSLRL
jgi:hypothetical protein